MICVSATRTMGRTAVRFHLQSASLWTPLINSLFLAFSCFLGDLNGLAVYGILLSLWLRETAWAGIFQSNTLWRFHFPPLILHWQLSFSPPLKSHFQSLMAVMSLCSLDSYSKCHWHNGRQPLASFDRSSMLCARATGAETLRCMRCVLNCHSQANLHHRKSKIHFQIVFFLFSGSNSQAVCVCVCTH